MFACIFWSELEASQKSILSAHVAGAAAVAFPLAADGGLLTAAMAIAGWEGVSGGRHPELRLNARAAALLGCVRSIVKRKIEAR